MRVADSGLMPVAVLTGMGTDWLHGGESAKISCTVVCRNLSCFVSSLRSIAPSFCVAFGSNLHFVNIVKTPILKDY